MINAEFYKKMSLGCILPGHTCVFFIDRLTKFALIVTTCGGRIISMSSKMKGGLFDGAAHTMLIWKCF